MLDRQLVHQLKLFGQRAFQCHECFVSVLPDRTWRHRLNGQVKQVPHSPCGIVTRILPNDVLREFQHSGSHFTALHNPSEVVCGIFV